MFDSSQVGVLEALRWSYFVGQVQGKVKVDSRYRATRRGQPVPEGGCRACGSCACARPYIFDSRVPSCRCRPLVVRPLLRPLPVQLVIPC